MTSSITDNIPSLPTDRVYKRSTYPLEDQLDLMYTSIADIVNSKKRKDGYQLYELPTNDTWVDGKTIFTKTITVSALTAGATNNIAHGITNLDALVFHRIVVSDGTNRRQLPYLDSTAANVASVDVTSTNIVIVTTAGFGSNFAGYATLYYTRS